MKFWKYLNLTSAILIVSENPKRNISILHLRNLDEYFMEFVKLPKLKRVHRISFFFLFNKKKYLCSKVYFVACNKQLIL